jgi:single-strand DNA-binding protein
MSNDLNQCNFIGRLGKDPEQRFTPSGECVVSFSIACGWKTKEKEGAEWVNISAFGKLAEICAQYLTKGSQVFISGRLTTQKWTDKDGQTRYTTKITADRMQMLGGKSAERGEPPEQAAKPTARKPVSSSFEDMDDDIPPF